MRLLVTVLITVTTLYACTCENTATPCSDTGGSNVVLVAGVLVDSGEGHGTGPARILVEEALFNVPDGLKEVDVDTMAGTSCYYRLKKDDRYVIFAKMRDGLPLRLTVEPCSKTFRLLGNEHILEALRNMARGGPSRLVGIVRRSVGDYSMDGAVAGASVVALSSTDRYETVSDASGRYEISNIAPGQYQMEITKPGFVPDQRFNRRWSGFFFSGNAKDIKEREARGNVFIGTGACHVWDLSMWPNGRIAGIVRNTAGQPLGAVTVQAFALTKNGKQASRPMRIGVTDDSGTYRIEPLPGGDYFIGVNAQSDSDDSPYPPTLFGKQDKGSHGARVPIADGGEANHVDLVLQGKRTPVTLRVLVVTPNGAPLAGAGVRILNAAGVQRGYAKDNTTADGFTELPVYLGEQYIVEAYSFHRPGKELPGNYDSLEGGISVEISKPGMEVTVVLAPKTLQPFRELLKN